MMMIAVEIFADDKSTGKEILCRFPDISLRSADHFDPGGSQSVDSSAADTAADEQIDFFCRQQSG